MSYNVRIADLPATERPRERLVTYGVKHLATAELLALLLGTGCKAQKLSAVGLGQQILHQLGEHQRDPLEVLRNVSPQELMQIQGIGLAKAATIVAAVELGKRTFQTRPAERQTIEDPATAVAYLSHDLMWQETERFAILLLDVRNRVLGTQVLTIGTATETLAHPPDMFREVIRQGANRAIVAHNHPSGNVSPSLEDIELTRRLLQIAQILSIPILDHLILGHGNFASLRKETTLWEELPQDGE
ncbi:MAG: DNA repair protein RadC [Cyanobacteria bacterium SID2]|nr:DNA repair protein RadC [Cyanobacteria bacterium SID2]MBP0002130.1 DNA repair protein RadC [Cyanobacteria bacterium SBC]